MIDLQAAIRQLRANADAVRALLSPLPDEQANWKPDPDTWSLQQVLEHFYNEERIDFRMHLQEILSDPPLPWGALEREGYITVGDWRKALDRFLSERESSLAWLRALEPPDWDAAFQVRFGSDGEPITLRAGDLLASWVAHDYLHIRQINELLYAWVNHQTGPYSVAYAGGW